MNWITMALTAGMIIAVQGAVNARLGKDLGNPMLGTLTSFAIGTLFVLLYCLVARIALPSASTLARVPIWAWFGGLLGVFYVTAVITTVPRLGAGTVAGLTVAGQMLMAVTLDHWGLLGLERHAVSPLRALGVILVIGGVVLLKRF